MSSIIKANFVRTLPATYYEKNIEDTDFISDSVRNKLEKVLAAETEKEKSLNSSEDVLNKFIENAKVMDSIGQEFDFEKRIRDAETAAEEILANAREKAEQIEREALKRSEEMIQNAESQSREIASLAGERGYAEGFEKGSSEGKISEAEKVKATVEELKYLIETINIERAQNYMEAQEELAKLSFEIAKKIMRQQIKVEKESIPRMIEDIIRENETALRIYLSEYNHTLFTRIDRMTREKIKELLPEVKVVILPNDDSDSDIIQIETENGMIDAGVQGQLDRLKEAVMTDE